MLWLSLLYACSIGDVAPAAGVASLSASALEAEVVTKRYLQACVVLEVEVEGTALEHDTTWRIDSVPAGSIVTTDGLSAPEDDTLCFFPDLAGTYSFTGIATLGQLTDSATFTVIVEDYLPPVADAGDDQTVRTGAVVTLDGTDSHDPDGSFLSYAWWVRYSPPDASGALIDAYQSVATLVPEQPGRWVIDLRVADSDGFSDIDTVEITVVDGVTAVLSGSDVTARDTTLPTLISHQQATPAYRLDGRGSSSPKGPLSYAFSVSGAADASELSGGDTGIAWLEVGTGGDDTLEVTLTVDDGTETSTASWRPLHPRVAPFAADLEFLGTATMVRGPGADLDDDGHDDLIVALPSDGPGAVGWLPGPLTTGGVLTAQLRPLLEGAQTGDSLGSGGAIATGDVDRDGWVDLLVGAPANDEDAAGGGAAYLVLGPLTAAHDLSDGADWTLFGSTTSARLGTAVAMLAHDDTTELLVCDLLGDCGLHDPDEATPLATLSEVRALPAGDLDGDGWMELAVVPLDTLVPAVLAGPHTGTLDPSSGALGVTTDPAVLAPAGDLDGDGYDDLWLGAPAASTAWLLQGPVTPGSERVAATLSEVTLSLTGHYGPPGDLDGDGAPDALMGDRLVPGPVTGQLTLWEPGSVLLEDAAVTDDGAQPVFSGDLDSDGSDDVVWLEAPSLYLFFGHPD